jgi:hypothetical protein
LGCMRLHAAANMPRLHDGRHIHHIYHRSQAQAGCLDTNVSQIQSHKSSQSSDVSQRWEEPSTQAREDPIAFLTAAAVRKQSAVAAFVKHKCNPVQCHSQQRSDIVADRLHPLTAWITANTAAAAPTASPGNSLAACAPA